MEQKIRLWLEKELGFKSIIVSIFFFFILWRVYLFFAFLFLNTFYGENNHLIPRVDNFGVPSLKVMSIILAAFLISYLITAAIEEILFRLPIRIFSDLFYKKSLALFLLLVLFVSLLFGLMHRYVYFGVFVQGGYGLVLSYLFIKSGALKGKVIKPFFSVVLAHFVFNYFSLLLIIFISIVF